MCIDVLIIHFLNLCVYIADDVIAVLETTDEGKKILMKNKTFTESENNPQQFSAKELEADRIVVNRIVVGKLVEVYGKYPSSDQKKKVSFDIIRAVPYLKAGLEDEAAAGLFYSQSSGNSKIDARLKYLRGVTLKPEEMARGPYQKKSQPGKSSDGAKSDQQSAGTEDTSVEEKVLKSAREIFILCLCACT